MRHHPSPRGQTGETSIEQSDGDFDQGDGAVEDHLGNPG